MESFFRYVAYIDYYKNEDRIGNVGFLKWKLSREEHTVEIGIKGLPDYKKNCSVREIGSGKLLGILHLEQGMSCFEKNFPAKQASGEAYIELDNGRLYLKDIIGFQAEITPAEYLKVAVSFEDQIQKENPKFEKNKGNDLEREEEISKRIKENSGNKGKNVNNIEDSIGLNQYQDRNKYQEEEKEIKKEENVILYGIQEKYEVSAIKKDVEILKPIPEDKWELLCLEYPKVHPFVNDKVFLSIKPKDFIILRQDYQKLVSNSFLLHGFYNYGHMILGKLTDEKDAPIYIGVPGVYYEREKQAAQMFGFVGFEGTSQPVQQGSFGYYMIEVEI